MTAFFKAVIPWLVAWSVGAPWELKEKENRQINYGMRVKFIYAKLDNKLTTDYLCRTP